MPTIAEMCAEGLSQHQAGRLEEAERIYRQVLAIDPNNVNALHLLGVVASQVGQHEMAVSCIRRAIELKGTDADFHSNLGYALKELGKLDEAIAAYGRAVELKPEHVEAHCNLGIALQDQGKLEAATDSYHRALTQNPNLAEVHNNLGTALKARGKLNEAVLAYQRALELNPDYAEALNNLSNVLLLQRKADLAAACCRRALELKPDFAEAFSNLGNALHDLEKPEEAASACRRALQLKPDLAEAHSGLGNALKFQGKLDEAGACYRRALELKPNFAEAHNNLGTILQAQGDLDEAIAAYDRALELKPDFGLAHSNQALLTLLKGDLARGWLENEWRWKTGQLIEREFTQPRWDGRPLEGRTILLHAEQGLGDTIHLVRYAAAVKEQNPSATVIVECQRPLARLLAGQPGIDRLIAEGDELPAFDVHSPMLSVPGILQTTLETIPANVPYLFADAELVGYWGERLKEIGGFRVGINWQGRAGHGEFRKRNIPLELFAPLARLPGVHLVSLQKGVGRDELLVANRDGLTIIDLGDDVDTVHGPFMDTAAIMMNLDLVVSSDTSVPHLAGALGVPVWLALPYVPDWRWLLERGDSPWYPTMRLFRQKTPGDWTAVCREAYERLRERIAC